MLLLDKLFTWPASGLLWVIEELEQAAREERTAEADAIRGELRELYLQLESGSMMEEAFDAREAELLDRLEVLEEAMRADAEDEEEDEDDEEDDEQNKDEDEEEDGGK